MHPSLPGPTDTTSSRSFLPLTLFESGLPSDVINNITGGGLGYQRFQVNSLTLLRCSHGKLTLVRGTGHFVEKTVYVHCVCALQQYRMTHIALKTNCVIKQC